MDFRRQAFQEAFGHAPDFYRQIIESAWQVELRSRCVRLGCFFSIIVAILKDICLGIATE